MTTPQSFHFSVATWNVWFGPHGNGYPHGTARMQEIVRLLLEEKTSDTGPTTRSPLWCIGFQEVVAETMPALQANLEAAGYHFLSQRSIDDSNTDGAVPFYYCALAIHSSLVIVEQGWIPFASSNTNMERGFLYVHVRVVATPLSQSPQEFIFGTTHLESYTGRSYTGARQRPLQLRELQRFGNDQLQQHAPVGSVILTGDMNWDDTSLPTSMDPDMALILKSDGDWKDAWLESKATSLATESCYTYDATQNPMLASKGNLRRRFDRIIFRNNNRNHNGGDVSLSSLNGAASSVKAVSTQLLGTHAIPDLTWSKEFEMKVPTLPSDHFGFVATFQVN